MSEFESYIKMYLKPAVICLHKLGICIQFFNKNSDFVLKWFLINYVYIKLKKILKAKFKYLCFPDQFIHNVVHASCKELDYVDENSCVLVSSKNINSFGWNYICSIVSQRKYKIFAIPIDEIPENVICLTETMLFNINNHLRVNTQNYLYYLLLPNKDQISFSKEVSVSLINSTLNYSNNLTYTLLDNYFSTPKFLRKDDVFNIDIKKYAPQIFYTNEFQNLSTLYFKIKHMDDEYNTGKYIVKNETRLVQEKNINSFIPPQTLYDTTYDNTFKYKDTTDLKNTHPPCLDKYLEELDASIDLFLHNELKLNIRPVFMVQGSQGSGKFMLIQSLAKRKGLHFIHTNLSEIRTLATAQKEAKLRMIFENSLNCIPCILMLRNIELISINSEGKKDERALSTFSEELKNLFEKKLSLPLIIIATSEAKKIPIELEVNFIDIVSITHITREHRYNTLVWLLNIRGIKCNADLKLIAEKCSDFNFKDLEALVFHAVTHSYNFLCKQYKNANADLMILSDNDFSIAYEYMQRLFSDKIGAPRIPEVHWEDIGGLVQIKQEIMGIIELSMLMSSEGEKSGLLLYGPPGTGKTLIAKAIATEYHFHFLSVKGPELLNMYVGQSEENVRQIFEKARASAPCIIFFDELDSLAPNRGRSGDSGGVMDRVVSQLLTEMDGIESNGQIVIIGATNRPDLIDPSLLRPGRFDKMFYVGMYNEKDSQKSVLKALTRKFNLNNNDYVIDDLLEFLPRNLTGADLYAICSDAWMIAVKKFIQTHENVENKEFEKDPVVVTLNDFKHVLKEFKPSVSEEELEKYNKLNIELS